MLANGLFFGPLSSLKRIVFYDSLFHPFSHSCPIHGIIFLRSFITLKKLKENGRKAILYYHLTLIMTVVFL